MIYHCCNQNRKSAVLQSPTLNGIDYLEVLDHDAIPLKQTLLVHCLRPALAALTADNVLVAGGESVTKIGLDWVAPASAPPPTRTTPQEQAFFTSLPDAANVLLIRTDKTGDFSPYILRLVKSVSQAEEDPFAVTEVPIGFDPQLAEVGFSFKVECGPDFDCAPQPPDCALESLPAPPINYLAKDYGSFRTLILDRLNQLLPAWGGSSEADLGVAMAELIAYGGDSLSYQQDAVATEAYLETARKRVSLRRHAFLVDYHVHDGCNARAWIQLRVAGNPGDAVFLERSLTRFYTHAAGMPSSLAVGSGNEEAALLSGIQVFEPLYDAFLYPEHNQLTFYTWGDANCCLPAGATEATLYGAYPNLKPGDVLVFQEVKGPQTGNPADADIRHRCAVRITNVVTLVDLLFEDKTGKVIVNNSQQPTPVTEIQWSTDDALPFPLCISSTYLDSNFDQQVVTDVSVAYGNLVLADHGLSFAGCDLGTVPSPQLWFPPDRAADRCQPSLPKPLAVRFRPQVQESPLTQAVPLEIVSLPGSGNPVTPTVVSLAGGGSVALKDSNHHSCLTLRATDPAGWPQYFGVVSVANSVHPANFDLAVVYNPPGGAAGIHAQVVLEKLGDLSFNIASPNYAPAQINSQSRFLRVPPSYPPASPPTAYPGPPTMLTNSGSVDLLDTANNPYLRVSALTPSGWSSAFGVSALPDPQNASNFELNIVYNPSSGLGVATPVIVERFRNLSLSTAAGQINPQSVLIRIDSFSQTAHPTLSASELANVDPNTAVAAISLIGNLNGLSSYWTPRQDLLESGESDLTFVVEVESDGAARLRFGDNLNGRTPETGTRFTADYRVGNGTAGNVGADSLIFLASADARILSCRNPLPAAGGTDQETADQIRRRAPHAFLTQERAVTLADYEARTDTSPQVEQSVATLRWTGSWYTVFVAVEPKGGGNLGRALKKSLKRNLERYRLAGQDLELDSPDYVSLEIALEICVDPDYFQSDVQQTLLQVLSNRLLLDGRKGLFYPDNFTFGQTVYLSSVYVAARSVAGVRAVVATKFQPQGFDDPQFLARGEIAIGELQVARLENDPSYPDHGRLTLLLEGGK